MTTLTEESGKSIPLWRDERVLQWAAQIIFVGAVIAFGAYLYHNMITALAQRGLLPSFHFLKLTAGFDIGEHSIEYSRSSTYGRALLVGILNTIQVSLLGIVFATILGTIVGVARLSTNYLINKLASIYIEIIRNVPLLVLLVFWYTGFFLKFPRLKEAYIWFNSVYVSNRGIAIPWGIPFTAGYLYSANGAANPFMAFAWNTTLNTSAAKCWKGAPIWSPVTTAAN